MVTFSFCAEKMEFMTGIYEEDWSGDTDRINIRGSSDVACALGCVDAVAVEQLI